MTPLFRFGPVLLRGGLLNSTLSCTLLAELSVGRIILARKSPFAGLVEVPLAVLVRGFDGCLAVGGAGRDVRDGLGLTGSPVLATAEGRDARDTLGTAAWLARLGGRSAGALAAEAAVGAVAEDGSRLGRVGDLGRGLGAEVLAVFSVGA